MPYLPNFFFFNLKGYYKLPVASMAFAICLRENPISNSGTAIAGGGGDVESRLLGSDKA